MLSGGMRQRVMIAMALCCNPKLLIADEPTTALDVTIQAQIMELIRDLQKEIGMSVILITHDIGLVAQMADRVFVMYAGQIIEMASVKDLFYHPAHPYTKALLDTVPGIYDESGRTLASIPGIVPENYDQITGCRFADRCAFAGEGCEKKQEMREIEKDHFVRCHKADRSKTGMDKELIRVENLKKYYDIKGGIITHTVSQIQAVDGIDFSIKKGETLGLVGESGCGKSTIGQLLVGLLSPTDGAIYYHGEKIGGKSLTRGEKKARKQAGTNLQMIFQDSYSSLNPRKHIYDILAQPMLYHGVSDKKTIDTDLKQLLDMVGLPQSALLKYPHEFSGGQRQRIGIAKALSLKPEFIVCDEPVSALDVSIQAQILNLIRELQNELGLTSLFVGHGLGAVRYVSDRIAVMYLGKIVEIADAGEVFMHPVHPYTKALTQAAPVADPGRREEKSAVLTGEVASAVHPPKGCRFHPRCPYAREDCSVSEPMLLPMAEKPDHLVACPYYEGTETA